MKRVPFGFYCLLLLLTAVVLAPVCPAFQQIPGRDAGVFMYVGSQVLDGQVPYRDLWDHKQPLIFLVNAIGLGLSGGSLWGVWAMEFASLFAAAVLAFRALRKAFGAGAAAVGLSGAMVTLGVVLHGGNYTEEFALPFQFGALALLVDAEQNQRYGWRSVALGMCAAAAFLFKQSLIGITAGIGLYLLIRALLGQRSYFLHLAGMLGGALLAVGAVVAYFALNGALLDYWQLAFGYNQAYSNLGLLERLKAILDELEYMSTLPGLALGLAAWVAGVIVILRRFAGDILDFLGRRWIAPAALVLGALLVALAFSSDYLLGSAQGGFGLTQIAALLLGLAFLGLGVLVWRGILPQRVYLAEFPAHRLQGAGLALLAVAVMAYPIELVLIGLSARNYVYYYITLTPVVSLLLTWLAFSLLRFHDERYPRVGPAVAAAMLVTIALSPAIALPSQLRPGIDQQIADAVQYVEAHTGQEDTVLVWGAEAMVNFLSGRQAPSRYSYLYPLYMPSYSTPQRVGELADDIATHRPVLILDTRDADTPFLEEAPAGQCDTSAEGRPEGMQAIFQYVCEHYELVDHVGAGAWRVYRWKEGGGQ
ncbi:MAG: glycosyltransferase family 39 protein [Anaerolineaceae bacterium]|nr:glycosyltransferase family 39 protein [Anaerolineaceae bacterium]